MSRRYPGFTLIETLLSVAILGVMVVCLSTFLVFTYQNRMRGQIMSEVDQQALFVSQLISQTIRNADTITSPTAAANGASLSLTTYTASTTPTVIDLANGVLRLTEGVNPAIPLTNARVTASNLNFQNYTQSGTPGVVRYQFMLTIAVSSTRAEYLYAKTYVGSAALR